MRNPLRFARAMPGKASGERERLKELALRNSYEKLRTSKYLKMRPTAAFEDFRTAFHNLKADARNEAEARAEAAAHLRKMRREGTISPGFGSGLFVEKKPKYIELLQKTTSESAGEVTRGIQNIGIPGVVAYGALSLGAAKPYNRKMRAAVANTLTHMANVKSKKFMTIVLGTARYFYRNYLNEGTAVHDRHAEALVYSALSTLARNNESFRQKYPHALSLPPEQAGKAFFRHLIRDSLVMNFKFLKKNFNTEKMQALRYCLIGKRVNELTEVEDLNRLRFVASIFGAGREVETIDRFMNNRIERGRAYQALVKLQFKAMQLLSDAKERNRFYNRVCEYYGARKEFVDDYAYSYYYRSKGRVSVGVLTDQEKLDAEFRVQIEKVYGLDKLKAAESKYGKKSRGQPKKGAQNTEN